MAYVSVTEWRPEQVTEWLKGLDNSIISYIHWFSNNEVNGQQLLNLSPDELTHLGVYKLGHQELILEAVQHLRNFHYELDRENLQLLALKLSCAAHSLFSEIRDQEESPSVPTQIMADVANVIHHVKPLVSWLDRPPFSGQIQYSDYKSQLLSLSLEMATCAQRDRFAEQPVAKVRTCSLKLSELADSIIQDITDPMILQPATLDLATIKKKAGEDLDFFLVPSFHGIHQIGDMKLSSPIHQSGKIQQGDEIVQVNYQTVVGWSRKKVLALFEESPNDLLITVKRRPRHVKIYGQIYMKPYRLPSRKRASPYSRWNDNLPSPRPELLTILPFNISKTTNLSKKVDNQNLSLEPSGTSSSSDEEFGQPSYSQSPPTMRMYLPKPRASIQRRFTLSGPPRPSAHSEQFWRELQLERSWRSNQNNSQINNSSAQNVASKISEGNISEIFQLRDKSASLGNFIGSASSRSTTCVPFTKERMGSVKFELAKYEPHKNDLNSNEKLGKEERNKTEASDGSNKNTFESKASTGANLSMSQSLSISELNKLKRDAFFNNMECNNDLNEGYPIKEGKEGNSEKVKRVIENFKSEINKTKKDMSELDFPRSPGKVMEIVENFEKKENMNSSFKNKFEISQTDKNPALPKTLREKGRLDKSCSTPAYDTTENCSVHFEIDILRDRKENQKDSLVLPKKLPVINRGHSNKLDNHSKFSVENENKKVDNRNENRTLKINTNNVTANIEKSYCEKLLPDKEEERKSYKEIKGNSTHFEGGEDNLSKQTEMVNFQKKSYDKREILHITDTLLVEEKQKDQNKNEFKNDFASDKPEPSRPSDLNIVGCINKPIPAQRKSKTPPEKKVYTRGCNVVPLPPKPVPKPFPRSPENITSSISSLDNGTPPEPPPRLEYTFSKPIPREKQFEIHKKDCIDDHFSETDFVSVNSGTSHSNIISNNCNSGSPSSAAGVPVFHYDVKSLPSSGRRVTKPLNTPSPDLPPAVSAPVEKEKPKTAIGTLESLKAMLTLGRKSVNFNSPRSMRKKNAMLAKKRNVSVKEITPFENSGFLWYRNRKGSAVASWTKYFFVLQGSNFYGFKTKESNKADLFIHLPGFTGSLAEEVKSKEYSFKIYHTGTVFYFAANSKEDLQQWLDSVNLAICFQDDKSVPESVTYSQTDSDASDTDPETCFPTSPKMKKVLGSSPVPKPARSHQNLASDSKKSHDVQKRFGSLKKLSSQKNSSSHSYFSKNNESTEVASLDRKYLRFLGQKNSPTPMPTSRFRSYRKMQPIAGTPPKGKTKGKSKQENNNEAYSSQTNNQNPPRLTRKPLHSSNPSLIHPEMADYRITQEKLAEFRTLRNQDSRHDFNRPMTLEEFMNNRQGENFSLNRRRPSEGFMTLEEFLLRQEKERQRERPGTSSGFTGSEQVRRAEDERQKSIQQNKIRVHPMQSKPSTFNNVVNSSKKADLDKPQVAPRSRVTASNNSGRHKNAAMYHPPLIPHPPSASNQEDSTVMAFEMPTNQNEARVQLPPKVHEEFDKSHKPHFSQSVQSSTLDYQGIEYPPAFEPETYTLQHMLKDRQKRDSKAKK